jgi:hypothetical protein
MNEKQLLERAQAAARLQARDDALPAGGMFLNCMPEFWDAYRQRAGSRRRRSLVALFQRYPKAKLPVNNHWQANMVDPDLKLLLKRGILVKVRPGARQRPMNKSSGKRQSYLVLGSQTSGAV